MTIHELAVVNVSLDQISQHPDNANMGDLDAIEESIAVNGLYAPLLVQRSTGRIIAGNHRYVVASKIGLPEVPVIYLDVDDEQAVRIMIADNRTTRLGRDDEAQLYDLLDALRVTDGGLAGTGYTHADYTELSLLLEGPLEFPEDEPQPELETREKTAGLIYEVEPIVEDDGVVYSFVVYKPGGGKRLSATDLNAIRAAFGQPKLSKEELERFEVASWTQR